MLLSLRADDKPLSVSTCDNLVFTTKAPMQSSGCIGCILVDKADQSPSWLNEALYVYSNHRP
jgi:hypothetical protein